MDAASFDFYREISKPQNYNLLLPDRKIILVVIQLYQKEIRGDFDDDKTFTEKTILECIERANPTPYRTPHEKYNHIIKQLLHYFLWPAGYNKRYELKSYAREFCKLIEGRLKDQFDPTRTEKIFNQLIHSLDSKWAAIASNPEEFNDWLEIEFNGQRADIRHQVEILDKKVDETVTSIQEKATSSGDGVLEYLKSVDLELDIITAQIDELNSVFYSSEAIRSKLRQLQLRENCEYLSNKISEADVFLLKSERHLRGVRRRIDKIRPGIQALFKNLRKREFDIKTERFLQYLLQHSKVVRQDSRPYVALPGTLKPKDVYSVELSDIAFVRVNKKKFLPPKPIKIRRSAVSHAYKQKKHEEIHIRHQRQERLKYWLSYVKAMLEQEGRATYSPLFYDILQKEPSGFGIAIELAYQLIKNYAKHSVYQLNVGRKALHDERFPQYSLYEIEIYERNV